MQQGGMVGRSYIDPWETFTMRSCRAMSGFFSLLIAMAVATAPDAAAGFKPYNYRDKNFDYFVAGDPTRPRAAHTELG